MPHSYLYRGGAGNAKPQLGVSQRSLAELGLGVPGRSLAELGLGAPGRSLVE